MTKTSTPARERAQIDPDESHESVVAHQLFSPEGIPTTIDVFPFAAGRPDIDVDTFIIIGLLPRRLESL